MEQSTEPDDWVDRLKSADPPTRDAALRDLGALLVRGVARSIEGRYSGGLSAEDVVQEALLKITASLDRFEGRSRFTTWAMTIANRVAISELRRLHYRDVSLDALNADGGRPLEVAAPPEDAAADADRATVLKTLATLIETELTEKQRSAMRLFLEGLPAEEIARKAGSNRNAVYKLVHDARLRLRAGFAAAGLDADDIQAIFA